ncbi:MAG: 2-C-methyl-D-erythritol 2,4-cyclodiphosphate synthase [Oscillospiraceae bacterium]|nr:2-C-methyl-D-erythritol 2,4-cyclodiphosphate synthase [Oscillospiraceae bacterium]
MYRVGIGKSIGSVASGRNLLLGGVELSSEYGVVAARDSDIISVALCDALLGLANMGGINDMFPENEPEFRNTQSFELLTATFVRIANAGYRVGNVDINLRLPIDISDYVTEIRTKISIILETNRVNIKTMICDEVECIAVCVCDQNLLTKRNREVLARNNPGVMSG